MQSRVASCVLGGGEGLDFELGVNALRGGAQSSVAETPEEPSSGSSAESRRGRRCPAGQRQPMSRQRHPPSRREDFTGSVPPDRCDGGPPIVAENRRFFWGSFPAKRAAQCMAQRRGHAHRWVKKRKALNVTTRVIAGVTTPVTGPRDRVAEPLDELHCHCPSQVVYITHFVISSRRGPGARPGGGGGGTATRRGGVRPPDGARQGALPGRAD